MVETYAIPDNNCIYLASPHAKYIIDGEKTLIVKGKLINGLAGKLLYLVEYNDCLGIIKITSVDRLSSNEFDALSSIHRISMAEKNEWWPAKEILYGYTFEIICKFEEPKVVNVSASNAFIGTVEFVSNEELTHNIADYKPQNEESTKLLDDWRIVSAWYSTIKRGVNFRYDSTQVVELTQKIYDEIKSRGIKFYPNDMRGSSRELYSKVSGIELREETIPTKGNMVVLTNFHVKVEHFRPTDGFIPPQINTPNISSYKELKSNFENDNKRWIVEEKMDGIRATIHKRGPIVKIYDNNNKDITSSFPILVSSIEKYNKDLIFDSELVLYDSNWKRLSSSEILHKFLGEDKSGETLNDSHIRANVFDVVYYGEDLSSKPWYERHSILKDISTFGLDNIKMVPSMLVESVDEMIKACKFVSAIPKSEGALIKEYNSSYPLTSTANEWFKMKEVK